MTIISADSRPKGDASTTSDLLQHEIATGRLTHLYLLEGGSHNARLHAAKTLSAAVLCPACAKNGAMCDSSVCSVCRRVQNETHPDLHIVLRSTSDIKVDDTRRVRTDIYLMPGEADRQVYILPDADRMNVASQNAFLKVIEEPPADTTIVLCAASRDALLPTVISRCKILSLGAAEIRDVIATLPKDLQASPNAASVAAFMLSTSRASLTAAEGTALTEALSFAKDYYCSASESRLVEHLPKKREELQLFYQVMALYAKDVAAHKSGAAASELRLPKEDMALAASRLSKARLLSLYDEFLRLSYQAEKFGNLNTINAGAVFLDN